MKVSIWFSLVLACCLGPVSAQLPAPPAPRPWICIGAGGAYGESATVSVRYPGSSLPYVLAASASYGPQSSPPLLPPIAVLAAGTLRPDGTASVTVPVPAVGQLAGAPFYLMAWVHDTGMGGWVPSSICTWVIAHPGTRRFVPGTAALSHRAADGHARALLLDGRVLFCGGMPSGCNPTWRLDASLYDPAQKKMTTVGNMTVGRSGHVAEPLPDGTVLVVGGDANSFAPTAELFDPRKNTFRSLGKVPAYLASPFAASVRDPANGRAYVLIGGGWTTGGASDAAMLYDVSAGKVVTLVRMSRERMGAAVVVFPQFGAVLVTGGLDRNGRARRDADLFHLPTRRFYSWGGLHTPRAGHAMVRLDASHALVLGGGPTRSGTSDLEVFDAFTGLSTLLPLKLAVPRYGFRPVTLADGSLLIAGGSTHEAALPGRTPEILTPRGSSVLRPIPEFGTAIELQSLAAGGAMAIGLGTTYHLR